MKINYKKLIISITVTFFFLLFTIPAYTFLGDSLGRGPNLKTLGPCTEYTILGGFPLPFKSTQDFCYYQSLFEKIDFVFSPVVLGTLIADLIICSFALYYILNKKGLTKP